MFFTSFFSPLTWMLLFLCSSARWLLDLFRILQQPLGCLYGAQQANEGREVPTFFWGLSPPSANDRHRYRRLLAHPCSENLQISTSVGWASQIHRTGAQVLHPLASATFNLLNVLVFNAAYVKSQVCGVKAFWARGSIFTLKKAHLCTDAGIILT